MEILRDALQRFGDPASPLFDGWPTGRTDARHRWAQAFLAYVDDMVATDPPLVPDNETLAFGEVEDAFFRSITLTGPFVPDAATDFADAWRAGITALKPGAPANHGGDTFTFEAMDPGDVDARYDLLHSDLVAAFKSPRVSRRADLEEIAEAFHRATLGLKSKPTTFVVTYG